MLCTACSSNNKGKIEGKWKLVSTSSSSKDAAEKDKEALQKMGIFLYFEFQPGGVLGFGLDSEKPETIDALKALSPNQKTSFSGKYVLGSGNRVTIEVTDPDAKKVMKSDKGQSEVTIDGDDMTMKDPDGTIMKLVRLKTAPK
jgi:hypothetical protein